MPEDKSPTDYERDVAEARERLAAGLAHLADTYAPGAVVDRKKRAVKTEVDRVKTLLVEGREVYVDDDGVEHVREIRRGRIAAAAGGAALVVVLVVVVRRRRLRRSAWQKLVEGAQDRAQVARSRAKEAAEESRRAAEEARRLASAR